MLHVRRALRNYDCLSTYCRINAARLILKRGKVAIPKPQYRLDKEGNKMHVNENTFPTVLDIDPAVADSCTNPLRDLKFHQGIMATKVPQLPDKLAQNARTLLAGKSLLQNTQYLKLVSQLQNIFQCRQPPMEKAIADREKQKSYEQVYTKFLSQGFDPETADEKVQEKIENVARQSYNKTHHNWKQLRFDDKNSLVYMGARLAPNYRVLYQIFHEIHQRDENFVPSAIYNLGSGLGTVIWAANAIWGNQVFEYYNVDWSAEMNKLAHQLLSKDVLEENSAPIIKGAHFRQYPLSDQKNAGQFKMVVNAYSLMDQPSRLDRLHLVDSLWNLTADYLVLVEHGTRAGNKLILEARDFILWQKKEECHVFAPCTHEKACPKMKLHSSKRACMFSVDYKALNLQKRNSDGSRNHTEPYTYVVLKKGQRENDPGYPRILSMNKKSTMTQCQMCCRDGTMRNYAITKSKPSKMLFLAAKKSDSGDFLPVQWPSETEMKTFEEDDGVEEPMSKYKLAKERRKQMRMMPTSEQEEESDFLDTIMEFDREQTEMGDFDISDFGDYDGYNSDEETVKFDADQYDYLGDVNDALESEADSDTAGANEVNSDQNIESSSSGHLPEHDKQS